ncbi:MAG: ATP-binding cassette domain-containing protein, partial [Pseudomonadota bacterium]
LQMRETGDLRLELHDYSLASTDPFGTHLQGVNLQLREGEIVGIAGVSGNGQKELVAAISGETIAPHKGWIRIGGELADALSPIARRRLGLTFVPEERLGRGAVPGMSLADNALLTGADAGMVSSGIIRSGAAREFARATIADFNVKCGGAGALAQGLSGGNLQKFIVGREIRLEPRIMLVAQPTWGVDVGAAQLIRQALIDLRDRGVALLVISEELEELFMICDRIAVIAQGRLSPALPRAELSIESVGVLMSGARAASPAEVLHG